jgi:hypothetical protein
MSKNKIKSIKMNILTLINLVLKILVGDKLINLNNTNIVQRISG